MRELDQRVRDIQTNLDRNDLDELIKEWEFFILKTAVGVKKGSIHKQDEEWSIALDAFLEAVRRYDWERGGFLSYAQRLIHHRLVDHYRKEGRKNHEIPLDSDAMEHFGQDDFFRRDLRDEIESLSWVLQLYGLDFDDLAMASPKSKKTKCACGKVLRYLKANPHLLSQLREQGLLPVKNLQENTGVPRKTLERHRKYLIAAAEIITGEYPYLSEYIPWKEEGESS